MKEKDMFDSKYLESGEFYGRRYHNFSTLIIIPIFVFLLFVVLFGFFAKREITTKATGEVLPTKVLSVIQSTSNNAINKNFLVENRRVTKGQLLISFTNGDETLSENLITKKILNTEERLQNLSTYVTSVNSGTNGFNNNDKFGYGSLFNDYINQVNVLNDDFAQQDSDKTQANHQANHQIEVLRNNQSKNQERVKQYQMVLEAVKQGSTIRNSPYQAIYDNYLAQVKQADAPGSKAQVKLEMISMLQQQIDQLTSSGNDYETQIAGISQSGPLSRRSTVDKIDDLKQQQLASIQKEINEQQQNLEELKAKRDSSINSYQDTIIKSPDSGILHLLNEPSKNKYYAKGTTIAQIYPELTNQTDLEVVYYVSSNNIIGLHSGQNVRFTANQNVTKPLVLDGKVKTISAVPTESKEGSFYKCVASLKLTLQQRNNIKYGISGHVTIIKGQKSWIAYYADKIIGD